MFLTTKGYSQTLAWINTGYGILRYVIVGAIIGAMQHKPASLAGSRVPSMTSCPCFKKPLSSVFATSPDPMTPIFMP
jgi:hypothetical protein